MNPNEKLQKLQNLLQEEEDYIGMDYNHNISKLTIYVASCELKREFQDFLNDIKPKWTNSIEIVCAKRSKPQR